MNFNATIIGQIIAFLLFVLFCMKYVWPQIIAAIEKRQKEIADTLSFIEQAKRNLELEKFDLIEQIKKTKEEAKNIIEKAKKQRDTMIEEAKAEIEIERNKIVAHAQAKIDTEYKRTREELRKKLAMLIISGAEKIIERSVDVTVNKDIVDKLINEL